MDTHIQLSCDGSDRATAYSMSSKIVRRGDHLFVGWLDAPDENTGQAGVMMGVCDIQTGALLKTVQLGEGKDNHCGPALALDGNGRLHALVGAHHDPFLYRWSDEPEEAESWSDPEPLGPRDSYPALVADGDGTLHVAYREHGERWQLQYRRKKADGSWESSVSMAVSPTPGYNHFMHDLTVGPTGTLHLTFQFYYAESGNSRDCRGRAAVHIQSSDGGDTWVNEGEIARLPLTIETARTIVAGFDVPDYNLRIGNHVVDRDDHPWFYASMPDPPRGVLWRRTGKGWETVELDRALPDLNLADGKSTALSYDARGRFHILVSTNPDGLEKPWYDTGHEVFYLALESDGVVVEVKRMTDPDPDVARWLPSIEKWDWARPDASCADGHWFTYTSGVNAGLISQKDYNFSEKTQIYLGKRPLGGFGT